MHVDRAAVRQQNPRGRACTVFMHCMLVWSCFANMLACELRSDAMLVHVVVGCRHDHHEEHHRAGRQDAEHRAAQALATALEACHETQQGLCATWHVTIAASCEGRDCPAADLASLASAVRHGGTDEALAVARDIMHWAGLRRGMQIKSPSQRPAAVTVRMRATWTRWNEAVQEAERAAEEVVMQAGRQAAGR